MQLQPGVVPLSPDLLFEFREDNGRCDSSDTTSVDLQHDPFCRHPVRHTISLPKYVVIDP